MAAADMHIKEKLSNILKDNNIHDEIAQVTVTKPDLKGEHMASVIETARIDFENQEIPPLELFLKKRLPLTGVELMDTRMREVMLKEGKFLTEFSQELDKFSKERTKGSISLTADLLPKAYYYDEDVIVMENLVKQGYILLPKKDRQDFENSTTVVRHLAKLHAVSHVMIEKAGGSEKFLESHPEFEEIMIKRGDPIMAQVFEPGYAIALEVLKKSAHEERDEKYELMKNYTGKLHDSMCESIEAENLFYSVLHGDCHNNNMMFSKTREKVVLVDFQISRIGSPSLDLSYFLFTSTKPEVRKRWKELLQIYFDSLKSNVESLGVSFEFKFEDFIQDFNRKSKLGFFFGFFLILGLEALDGHDTSEKQSEDFGEVFTKLVCKWVENNPDKAEAAAASMISFINDYLLFGSL